MNGGDNAPQALVWGIEPFFVILMILRRSKRRGKNQRLFNRNRTCIDCAYKERIDSANAGPFVI